MRIRIRQTYENGKRWFHMDQQRDIEAFLEDHRDRFTYRDFTCKSFAFDPPPPQATTFKLFAPNLLNESSDR